jgi:hypothetical protein
LNGEWRRGNTKDRQLDVVDKVAPLGVDHGDAGRSIKHVDAFRLSAALDWPTRLKLISDFTRFGASATLFARHFLGKPDDTPEL